MGTRIRTGVCRLRFETAAPFPDRSTDYTITLAPEGASVHGQLHVLGRVEKEGDYKYSVHIVLVTEQGDQVDEEIDPYIRVVGAPYAY